MLAIELSSIGIENLIPLESNNIVIATRYARRAYVLHATQELNIELKELNIYDDDFLENTSEIELEKLVQAAGGEPNHCMDMFYVHHEGLENEEDGDLYVIAVQETKTETDVRILNDGTLVFVERSSRHEMSERLLRRSPKHLPSNHFVRTPITAPVYPAPPTLALEKSHYHQLLFTNLYIC
ncbi:hypothetical protein KIN20_011688 [Parelaphostrongylus tenuis]|uniref:Uncharacterized protein n=1 Tax=Parelaphostrongylus tenuis TaxID=148309 RepID=A0AAD5QL63_PARTN|nr:hypothetical protein KIN20_011688 [Parelaphostrongylus tenuis]